MGLAGALPQRAGRRQPRPPVPGAAVRTILFVDDHPVFREGLKRTLEAEIPDLSVIAVGDAAASLQILASGRDVDLLLADYRLPDENGLALLARVRRGYPTVGAGLFCSDLTPALIHEARSLGAVLGLLQQDPDAYLKRGAEPAGMPDAQIESLLEERRAARKARDFARGDAIRDELKSAGILIEDRPDGQTRWRRA